jgi:3-hydroxyacyl-[acyl-carrier-protein] dehydratase
MRPDLHLDPAEVDCSRVVADREAIRRVLPQRFDMEQLTAIVLLDAERLLIAGYKDVGPDEFWVRGHMPDFPLLPGVLICEAAAQLSAYFMTEYGWKSGDFVGFGGMENVRFRGMVQPGDRLLLVGKGVKMHRRQATFNVQGFVGPQLVFHGDIIGMSMSRPAAPAAPAEG